MLGKMTADALPVRGKMAAFMGGDDVTQFLCPLCNGCVETASHLFLECPVSRMIWTTGQWPMRLDGFAGNGIVGWMSFVLEPRNMLVEQRDFILYLAVVVDTIWYYRIMVVLELEGVQASIRRKYDEQIHAWYVTQGAKFVSGGPRGPAP